MEFSPAKMESGEVKTPGGLSMRLARSAKTNGGGERGNKPASERNTMEKFIRNQLSRRQTESLRFQRKESRGSTNGCAQGETAGQSGPHIVHSRTQKSKLGSGKLRKSTKKDPMCGGLVRAKKRSRVDEKKLTGRGVAAGRQRKKQ